MEEIKVIWREKVVDGFEIKQNYFEFETELKWEPVELLDVM